MTRVDTTAFSVNNGRYHAEEWEPGSWLIRRGVSDDAVVHFDSDDVEALLNLLDAVATEVSVRGEV